MKIALDGYQTLFPAGGISRYTRSLIIALTEMTDPPLELVLFLNRFRESGTIWKPEGDRCIVRQFFFPRCLTWRAWNQLKWPPIELFCGNIDLFHGVHFVLPHARKARRVLTVHDLTFWRYPNYFLNREMNERGYRRELPAALTRADAVIAVSHRTREDLIEIFGFSEHRVRVIHEGVDHDVFRPLGREQVRPILERYGLSTPYMIFLVGTPEPRKNLMRAVKAARLAAPGLPLVLIGPSERIKTLVGRHDTPIIITGIVPEAHLPALLSGASLSLYPSLYEGFGLPVLESMACGAPVIASNRGALPEIAGGAAMLVDPENTNELADAISILLTDEQLQSRLKSAGTQRAAEFTWKRTAAETLSLYRELL